ncbi:MAG: glycosyltransferase [Actinomycetota bacterium]
MEDHQTSSRPTRAVFAAQLPPPVHGQAVADAILADAGDDTLSLTVVPLRFARNVEDIGRLRPGKLAAVVALIVRLLVARFRHSADVLVYSLGARSRLPVLRDGLVLAATRPFYRRTVLHAHTGDYGERIAAERGLVGAVLRRAFGGAELILLDPALDRPEARTPAPARVSYLNYGVVDPAVGSRSTPTGEPLILFLGNLYETKGTHVLLRAAALLRDRGHEFRVVLAGAIPDEQTGEELRELIASKGLDDRVELPGPVHGDDKNRRLAEATVMCFPTHYEAEGLPLVVLEGLAAGLPVVSTVWRAIPAAVVDGETGALVTPGDVEALADRLGELLDDPTLIERLGTAARKRYEERFSIERFRANFTAIVRGIDRTPTDPAADLTTPTPARS